MGHHGHHHQEEKHHGHHHHGHHHEEQRYGGYPAASYAPQAIVPAYGYLQPQQQQLGYVGYYGPAHQPSPYGVIQPYSHEVNHLYAQEQKHKKHEHRAEAVALGAGAFAMYEHHQVKVDPEHAARHRLEESIAGATAVGAGVYALHEHQQPKHDHQKLQAAGYYPDVGHNKHKKKHHHGLFH